MNELGIPTAVNYPIPLHLQHVYANLGQKTGDFPYAENAANRDVGLPMHPSLDEAIIMKVVEAFRKSIDR
jgi:dTDP-4-amino-4,6-dideoxygalactose transaminase